MRSVFLVYALLLAASATAAEDYRVMKLEQDVRALERQLQTLQPQLAELQQQLRQSGVSISPTLARGPVTTDGEQKWLSGAAWDRIKSGMNELQVIEILGKPTALRPDAQGRRALLYTLEIGTTGFLTGSISFADSQVVAVQKPALK
jgi:hypothetical protein